MSYKRFFFSFITVNEILVMIFPAKSLKSPFFQKKNVLKLSHNQHVIDI